MNTVKSINSKIYLFVDNNFRFVLLLLVVLYITFVCWFWMLLYVCVCGGGVRGVFEGLWIYLFFKSQRYIYTMCMCVYVCMYICMYVHIYVCMYACMYECVCVCVCVLVRVCKCIFLQHLIPASVPRLM